MNRKYSLLMIALFVLAAMMACRQAPAETRYIDGVVTKVSDGDTVHLSTPEGTKVRVRLYGMDAPETEKRDYRTGRIKIMGQPYGDVAEKALAGKVLNQPIRLEVINVDQYKRIVGVLWSGNRNINLEMVREGYAEAYREYLSLYKMDFLVAEKAARGERKGIWGLSHYERPKDFRKRMRLSGES